MFNRQRIAYLLILISTFFFWGGNIYADKVGQKTAEKFIDEYLSTLPEEKCSPEQGQKQKAVISELMTRLTRTAHWQPAVRASIKAACELEYKNFMTKMAFSLAHYGLNKGLNENTVTGLSYMINTKKMGMSYYLRIGETWEKVSSVGISEKDLYVFFKTVLKQRAHPEAIEGIALIYFYNIDRGKLPKEALAGALKAAKPFLYERDRLKAREKALEKIKVQNAENPVKEWATFTPENSWQTLKNRSS